MTSVDDFIEDEPLDWKDETFTTDTPVVGTNVDEILKDNEYLEDDLETDLFSLPPLDAISLSSTETCSLASSSRQSNTPRHCYTRRSQTFLLKTGIFKNVKSKLETGQASCITIGRWLAIGTQRGLVFLFNFHQQLLDCLGSSEQGRVHGAVSALSINRAGDRILIGFARGHIDMWDISALAKPQLRDTGNCKLLRSLDDVHSANCAVLFLAFTDDPTLALCADSGGSLFQLQFKRGLSGRTCDSSCLFSGSRGEICSMEPLLLPNEIKQHEIAQFHLVAMATFKHVTILSLAPKITVHYKCPLTGDAAVFPLLAWQFMSVECGAAGTWRKDPILVFARDRTVNVLRVQLLVHVPQFQVMQTFQLDYSLINMKWLGDFTICFIDKMEVLHVFDVPSEKELEVYDLSRVKLSYNSSLFKSLATGGNVSAALAYAGDRACQHSVVVYEGQLLLLGQTHLHLFILRDWMERLECLLKHGLIEQAMTVCEEYYTGTSLTYAGLKSLTREQRRERVQQHVTPFIQSCLSTIHECDYEFISQSVVVRLCRLCAIAVKQEEALRNVYEKLYSSPVTKVMLWDALCIVIMSNDVMMGSLRLLPPEVMQSLIQYLIDQQRVDDLRKCVAKVDITCLDLDMMSKLCWTHGIYDVIVHIYTTAMFDYRTPLEKMTQTLSNHQENKMVLPSNQYERLGQELLLFTSLCLRGDSYNGEELTDDLKITIQDTAFNHLIARQSDNMMPYLIFDINDFLNMNTLLMEEPYFQQPFLPESTMSRKELLVERVITCVLSKRPAVFSSHDISCLCVFVARQLKHDQNTKLMDIILSHIELMFEYVCSASATSTSSSLQPNDSSSTTGSGGVIQHLHGGGGTGGSNNDDDDVQQALVDILEFVHSQCQMTADANTAIYACNTHTIRLDLQRLLTVVSGTKLYQVKEWMLRRRGNYGAIIPCYLDDDYRRQNVFNYVKWVFNDVNVTDAQRQEVIRCCVAELPRLLRLSAEQTVLLCCNTLQMTLKNVLTSLDQMTSITTTPDSWEVFILLKASYAFNLSDTSLDSCDDDVIVTDRSLCDHVLAGRFLFLCCLHSPSDALPFLQQSTFYNVERALTLMRTQSMHKECAYLLEKLDKVEEAAAIYLQQFDSAYDSQNLVAMETNVHCYITLCLRHATTWTAERQNKIWSPMLHSLIEKQQNKQSNEMNTCIKALFQLFLSSMSQHLGLAVVLGRIIKDPAYSGDKFNELRNLVLDMLETFHYESTLLNSCQRLCLHDLSSHYSHFIQQVSHGFAPRQYRCHTCRSPCRGVVFYNNSSSHAAVTQSPIVVFRCGHAYHIECLQNTMSFTYNGSEQVWLCSACEQRDSSTERGGAVGGNDDSRGDDDITAVVNENNAVNNYASRNMTVPPRAFHSPSFNSSHQRFLADTDAPSKMDLLRELASSEGSSSGASNHIRSRYHEIINATKVLNLAPVKGII